MANNELTLDEKRYRRLLRYNKVVERNLTTIIAIKDGFESDDMLRVQECWGELEQSEQLVIHSVAPAYGGLFTTSQRNYLGSIELVWQP